MLEHLRLLSYLLRPRTLFLRRSSKALGDNLLLTLMLPGLRQRHPRHRIIVETEHPELFLHNPHVTWATRAHLATTRRHLKPRYRLRPGERASIYSQLLSSAGLEGPAAPALFLTKEELAEARRLAPGEYLCVCPNGKQGFAGNRKEWGRARFQALVDALPEWRFVQIGAPADPLLAGVRDLRGLPARRSAAVLAGSRGFVGLEGGLMHLAKAVGRPAVIIYGGLVARESSAYDDHEIVDEPIPCSPCYDSHRAVGDCATMECMERISVARVAAAVRSRLGRPAAAREE